MDNIAAFAIRHEGRIARRVYLMMVKAFSHRMNLETNEYLLYRRIDRLSGIEPERYDMCLNSCCAYTRPDLADLDQCPHCDHPRFDSRGQPNQTYRVLPLAPRLRAAFENKAMAEELMYRSTFQSEPGKIKDIFDSAHYKNLLGQRVLVDGEELDYRYFSQETDLALGHAMDGVSLFKSRSHNSSCTPIITIIYNLPPYLRSRCSNILINAVIPGPKAPKDTDSFMWPITTEARQLARGVDAWNALQEEPFDMRAFFIRAFGDMMAMYKSMGMAGPSAIVHCRRCSIRGILAAGKTVYYCPLHAPGNQAGYDPENLPIRTHQEFIDTAAKVEKAQSIAAHTRIRTQTGINARSFILDLPGCDMIQSTPFDFMHLFFKNNAENQIKIWKGSFKPALDELGGDYILSQHTWDIIGQEVAAANKTIPSAFSRVIPNVSTNFHEWTAECLSFWVCYLAPIVLYNRLPQEYYDHFMKFRSITLICLQDETTDEDITELRRLCVEYVEEYERYEPVSKDHRERR